MTTCANCTSESVWIYEITPSHVIPYCSMHLPKFLNNSKNAGLLKRSEEMIQEQSDAFEALLPKTPKKSSKALVEEPVAEEEQTTPAE